VDSVGAGGGGGGGGDVTFCHSGDGSCGGNVVVI